MLHSKLKTNEKLSGEAGFTLLEMLVVLVVVSLIIGLAAPAILQQFGSAKTRTAGIEVNRLVNNLEIYRVDVGRFPTEEEGLTALLTAPAGAADWNGPYIQKASQLIDPWGNAYIYVLSADGRNAEVRSLGADGAEAGTGEDVDVSSLD